MGVRFLYYVHKEVKGDIHDDVLGALSPRRENLILVHRENFYSLEQTRHFAPLCKTDFTTITFPLLPPLPGNEENAVQLPQETAWHQLSLSFRYILHPHCSDF